MIEIIDRREHHCARCRVTVCKAEAAGDTTFDTQHGETKHPIFSSHLTRRLGLLLLVPLHYYYCCHHHYYYTHLFNSSPVPVFFPFCPASGRYRFYIPRKITHDYGRGGGGGGGGGGG